jgi:hypothetical protein
MVSQRVAAFEQAALDAQVPSTRVAAEAALSAFDASPDILDVSLAVIAQTSSAVARYHACRALRVAALASWTSLPHDARFSPTDSLRVRLVSFAATHPIHAFERSAVLRTAAALTRRAYGEESKQSRAHFFETVCSAAAQTNQAADTQAVVTALEMLYSLVEEFAAPAESETARDACASFAGPGGELFLAFDAANRALAALFAPAVNRPPDAVRVIAHYALTVLSDVLNFELPCAKPSGVCAKTGQVRRRGPEWHPMMSAFPALVPRLFQMFDSMRSSEEPHDNVAQTLHDTMIAIARVSRNSYPSAELSDSVLHALLRGVEERDWSARNRREERLLYSDLWRQFSLSHCLDNVLSVGAGVLSSFAKNSVQIFNVRGQLRVVAESGTDADGEEQWSAEVDSLLLDSWATFAWQAESVRGSDISSLKERVAEIVSAFIDESLLSVIRARLPAAANGGCAHNETEDFGFEDESEEEAQFDSMAVLCRFSACRSLQRLAALLTDISQRVLLTNRANHALDSTAVNALRDLQEDCVWLLRVSAAALADDGVGEVPQVPLEFTPHRSLPPGPVSSSSLVEGAVDGAETWPTALINAVFSCAELEMSTFAGRRRQGGDSPELSPRMEATVLNALSRIAMTYLVPGIYEQARAELAWTCVGGVGVAARARTLCLRKAVFAISRRGFEPDISIAASTLLLVLAPGIRQYPELQNASDWGPLPTAGLDTFELLPEDAVQKLGISLSYMHGQAVAARLVDPAVAALNGESAEHALAALNLLRGVTQCVEAGPTVHDALVRIFRAPNGSAFKVTRLFAHTNSSVSSAVITLAEEMVCFHMSRMPGEQAKSLFVDMVSLMQETVEVAASRLDEIGLDDIALTVEVLLSLLQRLLEVHGHAETCDAAFFGLSVILGLITEAIVTYPNVSKRYYSLTNELAVTFPDHIPQLPSELASRMVTTIQSQCNGFEPRRALEAVAAIAGSRAREPSGHAAHQPSREVVDAALDSFLGDILLGGAAQYKTVMDAASDALLPLFLCGDRAHLTFQQVGQKLVGRGSGIESAATSAMLDSLASFAREVGPLFGYGGSRHRPASNLARQQARVQWRQKMSVFSAHIMSIRTPSPAEA